jgi:hypothetical protein
MAEQEKSLASMRLALLKEFRSSREVRELPDDDVRELYATLMREKEAPAKKTYVE